MSRCYYCCCLFCLWYYQYKCIDDRWSWSIMRWIVWIFGFFFLYRIHFLIQNIVDAWWIGCGHCGFSRFNLKCQVAIFVVAVLMFNQSLHHAMPGTHNQPHPTLVYIKSKERHIMNQQYTSLYQFKWHFLGHSTYCKCFSVSTRPQVSRLRGKTINFWTFGSTIKGWFSLILYYFWRELWLQTHRWQLKQSIKHDNINIQQGDHKNEVNKKYNNCIHWRLYLKMEKLTKNIS